LTGPQGDTGPVGPAGEDGIGFNFRNTFDNNASYAVNDVVSYGGSTYVAITTNQGPNNPTPDQNPAAWSLMAQQGATGAAGQNGAPGQAGQAATIAVGSTNTLPSGSIASVTNSGTSNAAILNFGIPRDPKGLRE
jgi:hypothetical protein